MAPCMFSRQFILGEMNTFWEMRFNTGNLNSVRQWQSRCTRGLYSALFVSQSMSFSRTKVTQDTHVTNKLHSSSEMYGQAEEDIIIVSLLSCAHIKPC